MSSGHARQERPRRRGSVTNVAAAPRHDAPVRRGSRDGGGGGGGYEDDCEYEDLGYGDDPRQRFQSQGPSKSYDEGAMRGARRPGGRRAGQQDDRQRSHSSDLLETGAATKGRRIRRGSVSSGLEGVPGMALAVEAQESAPKQQYEEPPQAGQGAQPDDPRNKMRGHRHGQRPGRRRASLTANTLGPAAGALPAAEDLGYGDDAPNQFDDERAAQDRLQKQRQMMENLRKKPSAAEPPPPEDLGYGYGDAYDEPAEEVVEEAPQPNRRRRGSITGVLGLGKFSAMDDEDKKSAPQRGVNRNNSSDLTGAAGTRQKGHHISGDRDRMRPGTLLDRVGAGDVQRSRSKQTGGHGYSDRIAGGKKR